MSNGTPSLEELLLDLHVGLLDEPERTYIEAELTRDPELRAKSERLGQILRPLDYWAVSPAPENLADKILWAVEPSAQREIAALALTPETGTYRRRPMASLRGLIATAASIAIITTLAFPAFSSLRSRSRRTVCVNHLGTIFRGATLYQQAFAGALPFAGSVPGASWLPGGCADRPYESNSRHIFLLVKHNYGPSPEDFVCPAGPADRPMVDEQLFTYNDFARSSNVSYDSLNLVGRSAGLRPPKTIAYLSDRNPLFVGGRFNASVDASKANSPAHHGEGQTVLFLDGTVIRMTSPVYGPNHDNLWLAGDIRTYTGTETPVGPDDAFLIPGHPLTDLVSRDRSYH